MCGFAGSERHRSGNASCGKKVVVTEGNTHSTYVFRIKMRWPYLFRINWKISCRLALDFVTFGTKVPEDKNCYAPMVRGHCKKTNAHIYIYIYMYNIGHIL